MNASGDPPAKNPTMVLGDVENYIANLHKHLTAEIAESLYFRSFDPRPNCFYSPL